jgi:hypothetical protein
MTQPKQPFKVGDRVAVYVGPRYTGTITTLSPETATVDAGKYGEFYVHIKQCRHLKPKRERLEMKGTFTRADLVPADDVVFWPGGYREELKAAPLNTCFRFREVRKPKEPGR